MRGAWSRCLSRCELVVLVFLCLWAVAPVVYLVAMSGGRVLDGGDGMFGSTDMLQYLAWIRDSAGHVVASNLFQIEPNPHRFLHPMFLVSAALVRLGLPVQLSYLLWLPVAVACLFVGAAFYCRRALTPGIGRCLGLVLVLFQFSPAIPLVEWTGLERPPIRYLSVTAAAETAANFTLWGYFPQPSPWA